MPVRDSLAQWAIRQAENGRIPDPVIRAGMRRVIASRLRAERNADSAERRQFWQEAWRGPIAIDTASANEQHYEVPPEFFDVVLGPWRKYSAGLWPDSAVDLAAAEEEALLAYEERAGLTDGQSILDLGCGWGSFSLWAANRYPQSEVLAVSNSALQGEFIRDRADEMDLHNLTVATADINEFLPGRKFDRIVSIEMLEHVRNHRAVFERIRDWVEDDGAVFIHVFAHRELAYPYEADGPASWMAETFFTGGVMPSPSLLPAAAEPYFDLSQTWWIDGTHYSKTLESWLDRQDVHAEDVRHAIEPVYGADTERWVQRWRMFFMACSEMFSYRDGSEWGVVHHVFTPKTR